MIPGMTHCAGGTGPDGFGRANQVDDSLGSWLLGGGRSVKFDKKHDALLALMEWVEKGSVPTSLVGAKYVNNNSSQGVEFTRLLCPYPQACSCHLTRQKTSVDQLAGSSVYRWGRKGVN